MKIVMAPDSFKESLSALEVAEALAAGWRRVQPDAEILVVPMADGGEGTVDAVVAAAAGKKVEVTVTGPLGDPVRAAYGLLRDGSAAVIEMAAASGLPLVPLDQRDPRITTTRGTGELLVHALEQGARRVVLGIGGSATNDGGAGLAQALGYRLLDTEGRELPPGGAALARLARIDTSHRNPRLSGCEVLAACDVNNPLCGPEGASHIFGPQKGASPGAVKELDAALGHFAAIVRQDLGVDVRDLPGAGAAGGLGAGLLAFAGARLAPGVSLIADLVGLREKMAGADWVITGEGRLDGQSVRGKTPCGVARLARELGIPVIALAGALGEDFERVYSEGITAAFSICPGPVSLAEAYRQTRQRLEEAGGALARLAGAGRVR